MIALSLQLDDFTIEDSRNIGPTKEEKRSETYNKEILKLAFFGLFRDSSSIQSANFSSSCMQQNFS